MLCNDVKRHKILDTGTAMQVENRREGFPTFVVVIIIINIIIQFIKYGEAERETRKSVYMRDMLK
jgi:hypothetical protein